MTDAAQNIGTEYELGFLLTPLLPETALPEEVASLKKSIESKGGAVISEGEPKMRQLTYTITKKIANKNVRFNDAFFGWLRFTAGPSAAPEIEAALRKNDNLVRHLLIVAPKEVIVEKVEGEVVPEEGAAVSMNEAEVDREIDQMIAA